MRLFAVHRIGIFGTFKRGDQEAVQVVCHEIINEKEVDGKMTEIKRFSSWRLPKPAIAGWENNRLCWMYNGNLGIKILLETLQEIPELTKRRISLENDGCLMPMGHCCYA